MKKSVASLYQAVELVQQIPPLLIGERCNHNGSKAFREALLAEDEGPIENLIQGGRARNTQILGELESGRDRLLELTSFDPEAVGELNEHIELAEEGPELESFMIDSFERAGLDVEDIGPRSYAVRLGPGGHRPWLGGSPNH